MVRLGVHRNLQTPFIIIFSFILGCTFIVNIAPITKTCKLDDTDREHNIMKDSKLKSPDLIIIILSAPNNVDRRQVIRDTWTKLYGTKRDSLEEMFKVRHYFVVGNLGLTQKEKTRLNSEQTIYRDLLILPIHDAYKNLTNKVKHTFEWLNDQHNFGLDFRYMFKCDDDSFVNLGLFITELLEIERLYLDTSNLQSTYKLPAAKSNKYISTNIQVNFKDRTDNHLELYWGYFSGNAKIKTKGKWKETDWIFSDTYLPYTVGGGYLLSKNLVRFIAKNAQDLRAFNSEDVSVGFWLSPVNNVLRIHDARFDTEWTSRGCQNHHLVVHNIIPNEMKKMYKNVVEKNVLCLKETVRRHYYVYNWSAPPSQCCKTFEESIIRLGNK